MSRRIDIELTSARPDGSWTWRAAGAREPKGVLDGSLLPDGSKTGAVVKAEAEFELDGITILSIVNAKEKAAKSGLLELIPSDKPFEAVTSQLATRDRGDRGDRRDRPPRRDGGARPDRPRGDRPPRRDGAAPGAPGDASQRRDRHERGPRPDGDRPERRSRPSFTPPPEIPQRPKAKRLRPGRAHRSAVLAELPEAQRPVAERALQGGIPAVRQAVNEQNARLKAEGADEIPAAGLISLAEQLLPRLRVAEWLDRADAAMADLEELDLRDLRSVVAAGDDPAVARDESTRTLAAELKDALVVKQEKELSLWFGDIDTALGVGRVIRALKLSSQPPKAGVRFPADLATRLVDATLVALAPDALGDRWAAVLEAAAFSPVRAQVIPPAKSEHVNDELLATVKRLGPLLPQVAALYEIEVPKGAGAPKPLRPTRPTSGPGARAAKPAAPAPAPRRPGPGAPIPPPPSRANAAAETVAGEPLADDTATIDSSTAAPVDAPPIESPIESPATETVPAETVPAETAVADDPAIEPQAVEAAADQI